MRRKSLVPISLVLGALVACQSSDSTDPGDPNRGSIIIDGSHNAGNPHFFWKFPPYITGNAPNGIFDPTQSPFVEICALSAGVCDSIIHTFTVAGSGPGTVTVSTDSSWYQVQWDTGSDDLDTATTYRISTSVHGLVLGVADIDLIESSTGGRQAKNVFSGEYIPLQDGKKLNIKFRIESGIFPLLLAAVSGDGQEGVAGSVLFEPLIVRLTDASGYPAGGMAVSFNPASGNGSASPNSIATDAQGYAQTSWTLGAAIGSQDLSVAVVAAPGNPVNFSGTALAAMPAWCEVNASLDGGALPTGWTDYYVLRVGPGLVNNRLEGAPTDGGARIGAVEPAPASLTEVVIEYDALHALSADHGVSLQTNSTFYWFYDQSFGNTQPITLFSRPAVALWPSPGASIPFGQTTVPATFGAHHYRLVLRDGVAEWTVDGVPTPQAVHALPGFRVRDIVGFYWYAYTNFTTTWGDNLSVQCQ